MRNRASEGATLVYRARGVVADAARVALLTNGLLPRLKAARPEIHALVVLLHHNKAAYSVFIFPSAPKGESRDVTIVNLLKIYYQLLSTRV